MLPFIFTIILPLRLVNAEINNNITKTVIQKNKISVFSSSHSTQENIYGESLSICSTNKVNTRCLVANTYSEVNL